MLGYCEVFFFECLFYSLFFICLVTAKCYFLSVYFIHYFLCAWLLRSVFFECLFYSLFFMCLVTAKCFFF